MDPMDAGEANVAAEKIIFFLIYIGFILQI